MPKSQSDYWEIKYKNCSVWSYFRSDLRHSRVTYYKPSFAFGLRDIKGLIDLLLLRFSRKTVVFVAGRTDLLHFVEHHFNKREIKLFIRTEMVKGNVFFIETIRYIFRKISFIFVPHAYIRLKRKLYEASLENQAEQKNVKENLKNFFGDYYFNYFLKLFLSGNEVYYTNCVIPRTQRYTGFLNSVEIQHGVIYRGHLDYTFIPHEHIKDKLLVWNGFWKRRLIEDCYYPEAKIQASNYYTENNLEKLYPAADLIIFTTVSVSFSEKIVAFVKADSGKSKIYIQKHPRDYYDYSTIKKLTEFVHNADARSAKNVVISDSTLILSLKYNGIFFYYLLDGNEEEAAKESDLQKKYQVYKNIDYNFVKNVSDIPREL